MKRIYAISIILLIALQVATPAAAQDVYVNNQIAAAAAAADAILVQVNGIDGDATMAGYRGWSDVLSYSHGLSNTVPDDLGGGSGVSKPVHAPVSFAKYLDRSTPPIITALNTGKIVRNVVFDFISTASGRPFVFFKVELADAAFTSYAISAAVGGGAPVEAIEVVYAKVIMTYCDESAKGQKGCTSAAWDVRANMAANTAALSGPALTVSGDDVAFQWGMESQDGIYGFEIQRWSDGSFRRAAYVPAAGWTNEALEYGARVVDVEQGIQVFRLAILGVDGTVTYSREMRTAIGVPSDELAVGMPFPNPFLEATTLPIAVDDLQHVRVIAFDILGREVAVLFDGLLEPGREQRIQFAPGSMLPSGLYALRIETAQRTTTRMVTLHR